MTPTSIDHLTDAHGPAAAQRVMEEAHAQHTDLGLDFRAIFAARTVHALKQETHVVVGDHEPERRTVTMTPPRRQSASWTDQ
jgi:hypothetical protein